MNTREIDWIFDMVQDFMIDTKEIHKHPIFKITAYSNPSQDKIPIRFHFGDDPIQHIVLDYNKRTRLEECEGINDYGNFVRLGCDLENLRKIGYIDYHIDEELTNILNARLNSKNL